MSVAVYTVAYDDPVGLARLGVALTAQPHVGWWFVGLCRWKDFPDGHEPDAVQLLHARDAAIVEQYAGRPLIATQDWDERDWRTYVLTATAGTCSEVVMLDSDEIPVGEIRPLDPLASCGMVEHGERNVLQEWQPSGWAKYIRQWRPLPGDRYWPRHAELRTEGGGLRHWSAQAGPLEVVQRCSWQVAHHAPTGQRWRQKRARYAALQERERSMPRGDRLDMPPAVF